MPVRTLTLDGFRSYEHLEIVFGDGPHVVVGRNAAGKTNLVEALVVLSTGRSHRSSSDPEMVRWGAEFGRAAAIKAGDRLQPEEIEALLTQRHVIDDAHHCPHGRPTLINFTLDELEKRFGRRK